LQIIEHHGYYSLELVMCPTLGPTVHIHFHPNGRMSFIQSYDLQAILLVPVVDLVWDVQEEEEDMGTW
jgi:hypothetical protein